MIDYEIVNLREPTEEEKKAFHEQSRLNAIEFIQHYKNNPDKELVWEIITSRGNEKLIYGPCPV